MFPANTPFASDQASSATKSFLWSDSARSKIRWPLDPAASAAPMTAPIDVPTMWEGRRPASRRAFQAPAWARLFAPPPPKTATTLLTGARVVSPIHHSTGAPLGGPVVPSLLVRRLGHDRRHVARHAL